MIPELDKAAIGGRQYTNFYADGFTTEDGLIALLAGRLPLHSPDIYRTSGGVSFRGYYGGNDRVAAKLNQAGYRTEFLATGLLNFSNKGDGSEAWDSTLSREANIQTTKTGRVMYFPQHRMRRFIAEQINDLLN